VRVSGLAVEVSGLAPPLQPSAGMSGGTPERGEGSGAMIDWWTETDSEILECLRRNGPMSPDELGGHIGMSDDEVSAFLCMLSREGKVRIRLVEASHSDAALTPIPARL